MKHVLLLSILAISWVTLVNPYKAYFTSDYDRAIGTLEDEGIHFYHICNETGIDSKLAQSIIFPEVIRYNTIQNFVEEQALSLLYVDKGKSAVDFSIGYFQMKPSFVETLEREIEKDSSLQIKYKDLISFKSTNPKKIRQTRLDHLKNMDWQISYLCAFIDLLEKKYNGDNLSKKNKVLQFSAAYNYGFLSDKEKIKKWSTTRAFPYGRSYTGKQFTYSEIALHHYNLP